MILFVTIFIVTIAAYWFARTLTKPIHALADTMKKVEQQGDFSLRATVYSSDEIGVSTQAFNTLLDALQLSISFTNTFENLTGLTNLPGLATQRLMSKGFGYGAKRGTASP